MKRILSLIFIVFSLISNAQEIQERRLTITGGERSLPELINFIETNTDYVFFYKEEWIDTVQINIEVNNATVEQILDEAFRPINYSYLKQSHSIVLVPGKKIIEKLPKYAIDDKDKLATGFGVEQTAGPGNRYLQGRQPDMIEKITIGSAENRRPGKKAFITGKIIDMDSGEPLMGASMYFIDLKKGAVTNFDGELSYAVKPGSYSVIFKCLGQKDMKYTVEVISNGFFKIELEKELIAIGEVTVKADELLKRNAKAGLEMISVKTMKELPTLMGEKDVLKIAQMLPGVVSVGEGSGGINVRGGNADQNLFYINGLPIYNSTHLFGFFSSVNANIVNNFSIYKGQVPAQFGGRLSSIFNIETRKGNAKKFFTQGGISPISANVSVEAPIVKEKLSFMLSGRSSYSDWILKQLNNPELENSEASFYDFAGALNFEPNKENKVSVFAYHSKDFFDLNEVTDYEYANTGLTLDYFHRFSSRVKSNVSLLNSKYNFATTDKLSASESYQHAYELDHTEFKASIDWILNDKHVIKIGANSILYRLNRGNVEPFGEESLKEVTMLGEEQGVESSFYIDDNIQLNNRLNLYAGFRYSIFNELGPKTVFEYADGAEKAPGSVTDSLSFGKNESIVTYHGPEFRFGLNYQLRKHNSLKFSFTQMRQYLFMLSNTISIAPYDQWKLVDSNIKPPNSIQYSGGYSHDFYKYGVTASAELYYKGMNDIVEFKDGADFLSNPYIEREILQGKQRAYGAEFMLSKDQGKLNGWVTYTYSRSLITVDGEKDFEDINLGEEYPSNYDKPHVCNLLLNYKFSRRLSVSSNTVFNSGRPITLPQEVYFIDDRPFVNYSYRNQYRIPNYFRQDLSLKIEGNLRSKKAFHSYWMISVYNLTGRENANTVFFKSENGIIKGYKYSVIGVPVFTVSWNWKLGNYASD